MAEKENIYGIKYEVDIEDLKMSVSEASKKIKQANADFNEASSKMDNWATSVDGVGAKIKQLNTILEAERAKLAKNKKEYNDTLGAIDKYTKEMEELKAKKQQAIATYGKESKEVEELNEQIKKLSREQETATNSADRLKVSIANQQATVNRTEKNVQKYEEQLTELQQAQKRAEKSGKSLEEELKDIKKSSDDAAESTGKMSGGFSVMKGTIAGLVANGISSLVSGIASLAEESKEFLKIQGALETSSKLSGYTAEQTAQTYKQLYGILGDDQTTATTVANLQALGLKQDQLTKLTEGTIGAWAKYGDSIPIDGLAEAINETVKVGTVTGTFADVLNWAGTSEDDFNAKLEKCKTESERVNLVLQELSKQGLVQSAQDFRNNSKALVENNEAQSEWQKTTARMGEAVMPIMTKMKNKASELLNAFLDLVGGKISFQEFAGKIKDGIMQIINGITQMVPQMIDKGMELLTNLSAGFAQAFPTVLMKLLDLIQGLGDTLSAKAPEWINKGFEMLGNLAQGLIDALPIMIEKVPKIVSTFANIINDNIPTILKKGADLLLQLVSGILSAIPTLVENIPQIIRAFVDALMAFQWMNLGKNVIKFLADGIKGMGAYAKSAGKSILEAVKSAIQNLPQTLMNIGKKAISGLSDAISGAWSMAKGAAKKVGDAILSAIKELPGKMLSVGKDLVKGLWNGISDMTGWIMDKIMGFGESVLGGIKDFFGIHSPSKKTYWMGEMLDVGLGNAIADGTKKVVKKAKNMVSTVMGTMKKGLQDTIQVNPELIANAKNSMAGMAGRLGIARGGYAGMEPAGAGGNVNNITLNQYNTSPKAIDSLEVYRNTKKQLRQLKNMGRRK